MCCKTHQLTPPSSCPWEKGANTGIGKEAARKFILSNRYAKVILACRNEEKGTRALLEIEPDSVLEARAVEAAAAKAGEQTESEQQSVKEAREKVRRGEVVGLDLASLKSVAAFAEGIKKKCKDQGLSLSLLVNNAGRADFYGPRVETGDGLEATWGVNHVGHFLLTVSLLPLLQASMGRVVTVSSSLHDSSRRGGSSKGAHPVGLGDLSDLNQKKGLGPGGKFDSQLACECGKGKRSRGRIELLPHPPPHPTPPHPTPHTTADSITLTLPCPPPLPSLWHVQQIATRSCATFCSPVSLRICACARGCGRGREV